VIDRRYLVDTLFDLIRVPTEVPMGTTTLMAPDDPKLVHYVQAVVRPKLTAIGAYDVQEVPLNQLIARHGDGTSGRSLLVMAYTPTQHSNLMADPFCPRIASAPAAGFDEPCVYGQGVSQNKVHMAVALSVLKWLIDREVPLRGRLLFAVNNEGRSSHACSDAILGALDRPPEQAVILIGTGMNISVGNRGRVDVYVHVSGKATHSSEPEQGLNAIEGARLVMDRVSRMELPGEHPLLGGRHIVPYQVLYAPLAPHTLPGYAKITFDRRLLPGDDIDEAVDQVRRAIGDLTPFGVTVERGVHMLPALVDPAAPVVRALRAANHAVRGVAPALYYGRGSFDAGGPCAHGVPTVMWGASGGHGLLGDDFVPLSAAWAEADALARLVTDLLA
jgi:acetylornithine deacetylase/succinyl-diaminopimelate desuccinylase-like protein